MLADAKLMLEHGRLESAADRAYYAMFHAAKAAVSIEVNKLPRTHKGVHTLFAQHFVATNKVDLSLHRDLTFGFELRLESSYEVDATFGEDVVQQLIAKADGFISQVRNVIGSY